MSFTLLQLIAKTSGAMGLAQPSVVIGSSTNQTAQMLALADELSRDLVREFEWQRLVTAYVFQTTAAVSQSGSTTIASVSITGLSDTAVMAVGDIVSGAGIPAYAEILTIDSATAVSLNMPATATGTVTLAFAKQDYALPADFDRMISDTSWDRTSHYSTPGHMSSQAWQTISGGMVAIGPRVRFRIYRNKLRITPAVTTVFNLAYEYVSRYTVLVNGGTQPTKEAFTLDTDTSVFPDDLTQKGLKYYFLKAKKLDFGVELAEFNDVLSTRKAQDVPAQTLSLAPWAMMDPIFAPGVPEGSWSL